MNELLELNINKFGEKIITYTNQIYSLISKLRRVCIIASDDYPYIDEIIHRQIKLEEITINNNIFYLYFLSIGLTFLS
jgi:hypothetical protein